MNRYYLPSLSGEGSVVLDGEEAHHAATVMRVRPGETVVLLNGRGGESIASVLEVAKRTVRLDATRFVQHPRPIPSITLVQSVLKGKAMDLVIQKATELGCVRIIPLETDRCVARISSEDADDKTDKWRQVCIESLKQCGSPWLPEISKPMSVSAALKESSASTDFSVVASLSEDMKTLKQAVAEAATRLSRKPLSVSVWTGPEGDFTAAELGLLTTSGVFPVTLGPRVLRSETAALFCLSVLQHELGA